MDGLASSSPEVERLDERYFQDPLAFFERLREECPVKQVVKPGGDLAWLITRYEDVRIALTDPRLSMDTSILQPDGWQPHPVFGYLNSNLLSLDPPDHTRLRRLVVKAFTARRVAALRPRVEAIVSGLMDAMEGQDEVDLIEAFAFPLPVTVICELLGVPVSDREQFQAWSRNVFSAMITAQEFRETAVGVHCYFTELLAVKRRTPADDLLSALITVQDSGDSLTERELIAMVFLLMIAGHETTMNLIANGTLALLSHPAELARLRSNPSLLPGAVEELLRYVNPVNHVTERVTLEPTQIGGVTIPAREWVICVTSSANHDPSRFPSPSELDVGRDTSGHLAFGHGIHYCLGAPLARLEGEVAFDALLSRFPSLKLAVPNSSLRWRQSSLMHALESLPVRLRLPWGPKVMPSGDIHELRRQRGRAAGRGVILWVPKTCATCADAPSERCRLGHVSGTRLAGPSFVCLPCRDRRGRSVRHGRGRTDRTLRGPLPLDARSPPLRACARARSAGGTAGREPGLRKRGLGVIAVRGGGR